MTGSTPNAKSMPDDIKEGSSQRDSGRAQALLKSSASASARNALPPRLQRAAVATQQSVDRNTQLAAGRTVLCWPRSAHMPRGFRTGLAAALALASGVGARALPRSDNQLLLISLAALFGIWLVKA